VIHIIVVFRSFSSFKVSVVTPETGGPPHICYLQLHKSRGRRFDASFAVLN
jgi:hypothetical protein